MIRFFLVAFGLPWLLFPVMYLWGVGAWALVMMFTPALGVIAQGEVYRPELRLRDFAAFFYPLAWLAASVVITTFFMPPSGPEAGIRYLLARVANVPAEEVPRDVVDMIITQNLLIPLLIPFAMLVNTFVAFGEEYGWRGYLTPKLAKRLGWVGASLAVGALWGLWHAPVLLLGHSFFEKFWWPSVPLFMLFCAATSPVLTWAYLRHGVWGAAAFHGGVNAFAGAYFLLFPPEPPWLLNPAGVMGTAGWIPLTLYAIWDIRRMQNTGRVNVDATPPTHHSPR
jgi:membrane protease YdiL (CAAX protease family)